MKFSPQSRVWIYQSSREFTPQEVAEIEEKLTAFTNQWKAHGDELFAKAEVRYRFFIIFTVDESQAQVTGCSIDSSVRLIKEFEQTYGVDMFDRFNIAYKLGDRVVVNAKEDFETMINIKQVTPQTIVFNNMVQTLEEFENKWEVPFANSWHAVVFA